MPQGPAFIHTTEVIPGTVQGPAFSHTTEAYFMGIRAKQMAAATFGATAAGRAPFGAGLFDAATASSVFASGAIATDRLTDGAEFVQRDGSVAMTGALAMGTNKITGLGDGTAATDAATKGQLDAAVAGLNWVSPVAVKELVGSASVATINGLSPTIGDAYVATDAGTPTAGTSDALVAGSIAEFDGTSWIEIVAGSGGFPPDGARALASVQTALNGTIGLTDGVDDGKFLQWDGTSLTPATETPPNDGNAVLVNGDGGVFEDLGYTYNGTVPTGTWVQFAGASAANAGAGLSASGNVFNVGDVNRGVQVNTDDLEVDASEIAGDGLKQNGGNSWVLDVEPADFAGAGLEDDGSDNLRIASSAAGNGLTGGGGSALAVDPDATTGGDTAPVTVGLNGVGVDVTSLDGDHLTVDFTPANYSPDAGPAEAADVDDLAAHLKGIDNSLASAGGTPRQETVTTENVSGSDTALADTLDNTPTSNAAVKLFLNGVFQVQGAGADYTISGTTITWLASSGTAVDMDTTDVLIAVYES